MAIRFDEIQVTGSSGHRTYPTITNPGSGQMIGIQTSHGYLRLGPDNSSYAHFTTDRPSFYFNAAISFDGDLNAYGGTENIQSFNNVDAAKFRDKSNTAYYVDPSSDSILNQIHIDDYVRHYGDLNTYWGFSAADTHTFVAGGTERMKITGDVHVMGTTDLNINGTNRRLNFTAGNGTVRTTTSNNLIFQTNSVTRQEIKTNGDIEFTANLMPAAENAHNIGSASTRWEDLYVDDGYIRDMYLDNHIYHNGDDSSFGFPTTDQWSLRLANVTRVGCTTSQFTVGVDSHFEQDIYGKSVNNDHSKLYKFGGLFLTWDSDSYGTNFHHSITSTNNGSYSDAITINSYGHMRINFDSNNNDSGTFSIGHHTTGTSNTCLEVSSAGYLTINPSDTSSFGGFILKTGGSDGIKLESAGADQIRFYAFAGNELYIGADNAANMRLMTDQSTRFFNHIIPNVDSSYDLGTTSLRFRNLYADTLYGDGSNLTGISASGNFITSDADDITTGEIKFQRNDTQSIIESENSSASNAGQLRLKHSYANIEMRSLRGALNFYATNTVNLGYGTNIKLATISSGVQVTGKVQASSSLGNLAAGTNGQQMEYGDTAVTTLRFDADRWRLYAGAGSGEVFTVEQNGEVGIKDSSPSYELDVNGDIRATGDVIAYSDERVKENIVTIDNALDTVTKLRGVQFNKIGEDKKSVGVIAQEVLKVLPEVVAHDRKDMYSVAYGNMVGVLIEAIKELNAEVKELKEKLNN